MKWPSAGFAFFMLHPCYFSIPIFLRRESALSAPPPFRPRDIFRADFYPLDLDLNLSFLRTIEDRYTLCEATGCDRPAFAFGLCERHVRRGRNHRKIHATQVREMRAFAETSNTKKTHVYDALAEQFSISRATVGMILRGKIWRCLLPECGGSNAEG